MTPQLQITKTDCLRACLACLLDLKAEEVPDFSESLNWWTDLQTWLMERGMFFLETRVAGTVQGTREPGYDGDPFIDCTVRTAWNPLPFPSLAILAGATKTGNRHMLIGTCEGPNFIPQFDPSDGSSGAGKITVESACFLVPRDPGTYQRFGRNMEKIEQLSKSLIKDRAPNAINHEIHDIARESLDKPLYHMNGREPERS